MIESTLPKNRQIWTESFVTQEALKYSTRMHFRQAAPGAYAFACRSKTLDQVCSHMSPKPVPGQKWDEDSLRSIAQKYENTRDFRKNDSNAYNAAKKKGILEYVCSHMDAHKNARDKPLKKMCKMARSELERANESRVKIGLKPVEIKIRSCLVCKTDFESAGERTCGCSRGPITTARLTGFDVI